MRNSPSRAVLIAGIVLISAIPAAAQRVSFERSYDVPGGATLDVTTIRGRIDVSAGESARVIVRGTATVRVGLNVPLNAYEIAKAVAANPPIQRDNETIRLRPPTAEEEQRAVTISYEVTVPKGSRVVSVTDSGATSIRGVSGPVSARTDSSAINLGDLGGKADVTTGSGAITINGVGGDLTVTNESSGISLRNLGAGLRVRTQSGAVNATFIGRGNVDVETGSSLIDLAGVNGGLAAHSNSGSIRIVGAPAAPWRVTTGSSRIELGIDRDTMFTLDAKSDSSDVELDGIVVDGRTAKGVANGKVGAGGPLVQAASRSGRIRIRSGR
jgi:hypothetical protein